MSAASEEGRLIVPLVACQSLSALGENLLRNALGVLLLWQATATSVAWLVPLATVAFVLPSMLLSGSAGALADRMDKARLATRLKLVEMLIALVAAADLAIPLQGGPKVAVLLGCLLASGCVASLFFPVKYGLLPDRLSVDRLPGANALMEGTTFVAILVGTGADGLLAGPTGAIGIGLLVLAAAIASWLAATAIPAARKPQVPTTGPFALQAPWAPLRMLLADPQLMRAALANSWFWIIGAVALSLLPTLAHDVLQGTPRTVSLLSCAVALGVAAGTSSAAFASGGRIVRLLSVIGSGVTGLALLDLWAHAAAGAVWHVGLDLFVATFGAGLLAVPTMAELQALAPVGRRAEAMASLNVVSSLGVAAACGLLAVTSWLGSSAPVLLGLVGVSCLAVGAAIGRTTARNKVGDALWLLFRITHRVTVDGSEDLPDRRRNAVLVANHVSWLDASLLVAMLEERPIFAIDARVANIWWVRPMLRFIDAVPTEANSPHTMRRLIEAVRGGRTAIVFPEGRISVTGSVMSLQGGALMVADQAGVPIVPVRIIGLERSPFSRLDRTQTNRTPFPKVTVTVWSARTPVVPDEAVSHARRAAAVRWLGDLMSEMTFRTTNTDLTLVDAVREAGRRVGMGREAVADPIRGVLSYRKLLAGAAIYGRRLQGLGPAGSPVGVLLPNAGGTLVTLLGLTSAGLVPVMLNPRAGLAALDAARRATGLTHVVTARALIERLSLGLVVEQLAGSGTTFHYLEDLVPTLGEKIRGLMRRGQPLVPTSPDDPAVILMTSGSSGTPKAVVHSHRALISNAAQVGAVIDFGRRDKVLNAMPLFHAFGLSSGTLLPLMAGARVFLYPNPLDYRGVPHAAYMLDATVLFVTQVFAEGYLRRADARAFRSVRLVVGGAAKFRDATIAAWNERFGLRILVGYGLTETAPVLALNTPSSNRFGTAGRILPGIDTRFVPVENIDADGVLQVRGPNVMLGTMTPDQPGVLRRLDGDWFDTGDVVRLTPEGHILIVDRLGRFAKIGGEKVSLDEVECMASELWPQAEHVAVAVPDDRKGERVVLLTTKTAASRGALVEAGRKKGLSELNVPSDIRLIEQVPMLGSGKPDLAQAKRIACGSD